METSYTKIEKISLAHRNLMGEYITIVKKLEDRTIKTSFNFDRTNPLRHLKNKQIGYYEKFQLIGKFIGYIADKYADKRVYHHFLMKLKRQPISESENLPTRVRIHTRLLTYFFKTHIRTKLLKLHRLYLREIVLQNKGEQNATQIEELRRLDSDISQYLDILPNPAKWLGVTLGSGLATIVSLIEFFDLDTIIISKLQSLSLGDIIGGFLVALVYGLFFVPIIVRTFAIKRALFLKTNSWYDYLDIYLAKGNDLYKKSIYRLEDELFEALNGKDSKPKESPVDFWIQLVIRGPIFAFFVAGISKKLIDWLVFQQTFTQIEISLTIASSILMPIAGFFYFVSPYWEYRRRKNYNLL